MRDGFCLAHYSLTMLTEVLVISGVGLLSALFYSYVLEPLLWQRKASLPPGPPGHWLFGNALPGP